MPVVITRIVSPLRAGRIKDMISSKVRRMLFVEERSHTFIVKIWLEEEATEAKPPLWRGHVTHVADGEKAYLQNTRHLVAFINRYLEQWEPAGRNLLPQPEQSDN